MKSTASTNPASPAPGWKRLDGIDLLRGLAIFLVLMNHVNIRLSIAKVPYTRGIPAPLAGSLIWNGRAAVQIFFAVSGFLIASTSLRRWGSLSRVSPRRFYQLRFARIAPLLLLLLAVLSALDLAGFRDYAVTAKTGGLGRALVAALTFHVNLLEARRGYLPGSWDILWSLSVEEMFYLFFPLVCRIFGRGKALLALFIAFAALGPPGRTVFAHGLWREYSYLGGMDAIALGCLTAILVSRRRIPRPLLRALTAAGAAILAFSLYFPGRYNRWGTERPGLDMSILAAGTCMIIAAAAQTEWRSPRLLRPLVHLGRRSYEVYLTHMFVVFTLFRVFLWSGKSIAAVPALFIGAILLAGVLGSLAARFYSDPMNRMLRRRWQAEQTSARAVFAHQAGA